jgi:hypothetical protein
MACVSFSLYLQDNAPERACFVKTVLLLLLLL